MVKISDDYTTFRNRIIIVILSAYSLSLVAFFAYSIFTFPEKYFLQVFRLRWTLLQTVVYFVENLTPVHCAAVLLACSLFAPPLPSLKLGPQEAFKRLAFSTVTVFVVFAGVFAGLSEGLVPVVHGSLRTLENRTGVARNYLELAGEAKRAGNRQLQKAYLEYYLSIDPNNQEAAGALAELRRQPAELIEPMEPAPLVYGRPMDLEATELFYKARVYLEKEDPYTAYYFADLARALSPAGSPEAERAAELAASIQQRLASYRADAEEREKHAVFEIKTQAQSDLSSDELYLVTRAYYTFRSLAVRHPDDPEAATYLSGSIEKLQTMAFFRDELERFVSMPGVNRVFFVDDRADNDTTQVVAIGGVITTETGIFARDVEAITFGKDGETVSHFSTTGGKIMIGDKGRPVLYMVGIDRTDSSNILLPEYYAGEPQETFDIAPPLEHLELLGSEGRNIGSHHLNRLWGLWEVVSPYGYPADPVRIAALMRSAGVFTFVIFSLFALPIGWRLRPATEFPVIAGIPGILILPVATYLFVGLYEYLLKLLIGSTMLTWGFVPAIIVLIAIQFSLIVLSIASLAAQSLKPHETRSA